MMESATVITISKGRFPHWSGSGIFRNSQLHFDDKKGGFDVKASKSVLDKLRGKEGRLVFVAEASP